MDGLRIYLGIALTIKGIFFITNMNELEASLGQNFGELQNVLSWAIVFAHIVGGASLVLGFLTRVAAGANALVLLGAAVIAATGTGLGGDLLRSNVDFQFTLFVFFCLVLVTWHGAGPFSLDRFLSLDNGQEARPETC